MIMNIIPFHQFHTLFTHLNCIITYSSHLDASENIFDDLYINALAINNEIEFDTVLVMILIGKMGRTMEQNQKHELWM